LPLASGEPRRRRHGPAERAAYGLVDLLAEGAQLTGLRDTKNQAAALGGFRVCDLDFHGLQSAISAVIRGRGTIAAAPRRDQSAAPAIRRIFFSDQAVLFSSGLWRQGAESLYCAPCAGFPSTSCARSPGRWPLPP